MNLYLKLKKDGKVLDERVLSSSDIVLRGSGVTGYQGETFHYIFPVDAKPYAEEYLKINSLEQRVHLSDPSLAYAHYNPGLRSMVMEQDREYTIHLGSYEGKLSVDLAFKNGQDKP